MTKGYPNRLQKKKSVVFTVSSFSTCKTLFLLMLIGQLPTGRIDILATASTDGNWNPTDF